VFQPPIGHQHLLKEVAKELVGSPFTLAGSYLGGAAMKDALATGFSAAEAVLARLAVSSSRVAAPLQTEVRS
jgi:hypothetical protein